MPKLSETSFGGLIVFHLKWLERGMKPLVMPESWVALIAPSNSFWKCSFTFAMTPQFRAPFRSCFHQDYVLLITYMYLLCHLIYANLSLISYMSLIDWSDCRILVLGNISESNNKIKCRKFLTLNNLKSELIRKYWELSILKIQCLHDSRNELLGNSY